MDENIGRTFPASQKAEAAQPVEPFNLRPLETDTLDEVSRIMANIQRRLTFGRAGKVVITEEEQVLAKLDKMIKELEEQQKKQQGGGGGGGSAAPAQPAQDSSLPQGHYGDGKVDPEESKPGGDWGNLPPQDREEALQQISEELPAHYRKVIEEYLRKLARDGVK